MSRTKKCILIDAKNKTVTEVVLEGGLDPIYRALDCGTFAVPFEDEKRNALYIDDEGLYSNKEYGFLFSDFPHQLLVGNGLIQGTDEEGDSVDATVTVEEIRRKVTFIPVTQEMKDKILSIPPQVIGFDSFEEMQEFLKKGKK